MINQGLPVLSAALAVGLLGTSASAAMLEENFDSLGIGSTAAPTGWSYVNVNGGSNAYITVAGQANTGAQVTGDNLTNAHHPPGSYLANSGGVAFVTTEAITGRFHYYIVTGTAGAIGRATGGVFIFGDVLSALSGDEGQYLGMQMMSDSFGNRGGVIDGAGAQVSNFSGNQREEQWYTIDFTWTPTSGTTGNFAATGASQTSSSNWSVSYNGFTFDSNLAYFGFGAGDYFGTPNTAIFDNISIEGTAVPEPASVALLGLAGLLITGRRRRA